MPITTRPEPCWELRDAYGLAVDDGGAPVAHFDTAEAAEAYVTRALARDDEPETSCWHGATPRQLTEPCVQATCGGCGDQLLGDDDASHFGCPAEIRDMAELCDWLTDADDDLRCSTACTVPGLMARSTPKES